MRQGKIFDPNTPSGRKFIAMRDEAIAAAEAQGHVYSGPYTRIENKTENSCVWHCSRCSLSLTLSFIEGNVVTAATDQPCRGSSWL